MAIPADVALRLVVGPEAALERIRHCVRTTARRGHVLLAEGEAGTGESAPVAEAAAFAHHVVFGAPRLGDPRRVVPRHEGTGS